MPVVPVDRFLAYLSDIGRSPNTVKAVQALRELDRVGTPVAFVGVAKAAEVSRSWLYTQPDISSQIRKLRKSTGGAGSAASPHPETTASRTRGERLAATQVTKSISPPLPQLPGTQRFE